MKFNFKNLLHNQIVLYVVLFFSITSMFSYLMQQNYAAVLFFLVIAFLTNYFSKNMIIVLGISVLATNMLAASSNIFSKRNFKEGMKHGKDGPEDKISKTKNLEKENMKQLDTIEKEENNRLDKKSHGKKLCDFADEESCNVKDCMWKSDKCHNKSSIKSSFQNLNPASYPNPDKNKKPNLDQAGTIEAAYDNLENILGTDSIRSMTSDTQKLADRQKELVDQLKSIAPLINQTTKMISSFNMDGKLGDMIDGLTKNMSALSSNVPEPKPTTDPIN